MEEQDAAIPFRVRVDVAAGRAGGDASPLISSVVYLFEKGRRRSVHDTCISIGPLNPI